MGENSGNGMPEGQDFYEDLYDKEKFMAYLNYNPGEEMPRESGIARTISQVMCPVLIFIGVPLTVMNAVAMSRISRTALNCAWYLMVGALLDTFLMFTSNVNCWLNSWRGTDYLMQITVISRATCKLVIFVNHLLPQLSNWCVICYVYATLLPMRSPAPNTPNKNNNTGSGISGSNTGSKGTKRRGRAQDVMVLVLALLMCFNIQYFWTYDIVHSGVLVTKPAELITSATVLVLDQEAKMCVFRGTGMANEEHKPDNYFLSALLDSILTDLVPAVLLFGYLVVVLRRCARSSGERHTNDVNDLRTWTPLILATLHFYVCMPKFVLTICELKAFIPTDTELSKARFELGMTILSQWRHVAVAARFFIYLKTSRLFRERIVVIKKGLCRRLDFREPRKRIREMTF